MEFTVINQALLESSLYYHQGNRVEAAKALLKIKREDISSEMELVFYDTIQSECNLVAANDCYNLGVQAYEIQDYEETIRQMSDARALGLINADTLYYLGRAYDLSGDIENAKISYETFSYCKNLKTIEIPESVTFIGDSAFDDCESLVDIKLPIFVSTFKCSFRKCNSLKSIELPQNISEIGNIMFYSCKSLISIAIPQEVKRIGFSAFNCCNSLEKVDIPYGVEIIRENAFEYCPSLSKVIIPSSLKEIGDNVVSRNTIVYYQGTHEQWDKIKKGKIDYIVYVLCENGRTLYEGNRYSLAK